jgi:hypothetical protein
LRDAVLRARRAGRGELEQQLLLAVNDQINACSYQQRSSSFETAR